MKKTTIESLGELGESLNETLGLQVKDEGGEAVGQRSNYADW